MCSIWMGLLKCANEILRHFVLLQISGFCIDFVIHIIYGRVVYVCTGFIVKLLLFGLLPLSFFYFGMMLNQESRVVSNLEEV